MSKKIYFAPMEGVTGYLYRNTYEQFFGNIDQYFTPFITPGAKKGMGSRERKDLLPENNQVSCLVPQILTNQAEAFLTSAEKIRDMGYLELNLNLGCPSSTVVSRKKGAGFLGEPEKLDSFLSEIFEGSKSLGVEISVKTRIGMEDMEEWERLLSIFCKYPVKELIIHPRFREDYYKGELHLDAFEKAYERCPFPLCFNGEIRTVEDYEHIVNRFGNIHSVMLGRGLLGNPFLASMIADFTKNESDEKKRFLKAEEKEQLKDFMKALRMTYQEAYSGERPVLFKLKEIWMHMAPHFTEYESYIKKIRKADKISEYTVIVNRLFQEQKFCCNSSAIAFYRAESCLHE